MCLVVMFVFARHSLMGAHAIKHCSSSNVRSLIFSIPNRIPNLCGHNTTVAVICWYVAKITRWKHRGSIRYHHTVLKHLVIPPVLY